VSTSQTDLDKFSVTRSLHSDRYVVSHLVGPNQAGLRLDLFLSERYRRRSREALKRAIESGAIQIDRADPHHKPMGRLKPSFSLQPGDVVKVISQKKPEPEVNFNYKTLYEDDDMIVLDKPPNLPVHPAGKYFFNTLLIHLKTQGFTRDLAAEREFYLVHRIDKETSGILLLAKTKEMCAKLTVQFRERETEKYYLAIVHGVPKVGEFTIDQAIGKIPGHVIGLKMYPLPEDQGGLKSVTRFQVLESRGNFSLVACYPKTGRQHQIRAHAEIAGFPLVGDKVYGHSDDDVLALLEGGVLEAAVEDEDTKSETSPEPIEEPALVTSAVEHVLAEHEDRFEVPGPTIPYVSRAQPLKGRSSAIQLAVRRSQLEKELLIPRHALHAAGLKFKHPRDGRVMEFDSPLPKDLQEFFDGC